MGGADETPLSLRQRMLLLIDVPRCARELHERLRGASMKAVETTLQRLARARMARCVTPSQRQSRLYKRTMSGDLWLSEFSGRDIHPCEQMTQRELDTRSWIQAGRYRRLTLRAMSEPMSPKQIRAEAIKEYERIGANHVHTVLRGFRDHGVAYRNAQGRWTLTSMGERFREIELDGLPERPGVDAPLWTRMAVPQEEDNADEDQEAADEPDGV